MKLPSNARNVLIIAALAGVVAAVTAGQEAASMITEAVSLGFLGAFAWIGAYVYREHRDTIYGLGDRRRAVLYGATGALVLILTATDRLWSTSFGSIVWLVLVGGAVYTLYALYRSSKQY